MLSRLLIAVLFLGIGTQDIYADKTVEEILQGAVKYQNPKNLPKIHTMITKIDAEMIVDEGDLKTITLQEVFHYPNKILMHLGTGDGETVRRVYDGTIAKVCREGKKVTDLTPELHPKDYQDLMETIRRRKLIVMEQLLEEYEQGEADYVYEGQVKLKNTTAYKLIRTDKKTNLKMELFFSVEEFQLVLAKMDALEDPSQQISIQFLKYQPVTPKGREPQALQKYLNYPHEIKIYNLNSGKKIGTLYVLFVRSGILDTDIPDQKIFEDPTLPFPEEIKKNN
ncbi:MAG: hypothetical protein AABZ60_14800 [Planctomycetota bacterium]